jgi:hypothetical protein
MENVIIPSTAPKAVSSRPDRRQTATAVNVGLTALYWRIGNRILREVLGNERAAYGEQVVATLSRQLVADFGRGFESKNLHRMMQFAEAFPDEAIVATLWRQLSWSHFRELLPLAKPHQREFYAEGQLRPCALPARRWETSAPPETRRGKSSARLRSPDGPIPERRSVFSSPSTRPVPCRTSLRRRCRKARAQTRPSCYCPPCHCVHAPCQCVT